VSTAADGSSLSAATSAGFPEPALCTTSLGRGILYELATSDGAGFAADESPEALGQKLALPPRFESQREQIEPHLTALPDTSQWRPGQ